jgi:DNA polymerase III beta subunit, N-terminal domain
VYWIKNFKSRRGKTISRTEEGTPCRFPFAWDKTMKFTVSQQDLSRGLAVVSHALSNRSTLPILAHVLLATDQSRLRLAATNLEIGIHCWVDTDVHEDGETTVPAKRFAELANSFSEGKKKKPDGSGDNRETVISTTDRAFLESKEFFPFPHSLNLRRKETYDEFVSMAVLLAKMLGILSVMACGKRSVEQSTGGGGRILPPWRGPAPDAEKNLLLLTLSYTMHPLHLRKRMVVFIVGSIVLSRWNSETQR